MLIIISSSVFAEVTAINITGDYVNSSKRIYFTGTSSEESGTAQLTVVSNKNATGIDFNVNIVGSSFSGSFNVDISGTPVSGAIPTIDTDTNDMITVKGKLAPAVKDTIWVDSIKPVNGAILAITGDYNYGNYYSGKINVSYTPGTITDSTSSGVDKHIIYVVPVGSIDSYSSATKKFINNNDVGTKDINSLYSSIADGNYYVVIDANDMASNYSLSTSVLATKKNVYFDNTKPTISTVSVGTIDSNKVYVGDTTFDLTVLLSDTSGIKTSSILSIILPNLIAGTPSYYDEDDGFVIAAEDIGDWEDKDIFKVSIDANDNVNNRYTYDFNIIVDLNAPTVPVTTATIEDKDKNVTITWTAVTDTGSGLKEYKVYRGTSPFTTTLPSTLVCTTTALTCVDDDEDKDLDEDYYYGVVAIDNAGNISAANTDSVWTGPDCSIEINDGNDFTNLATVNLDLTYSNDVNEIAFSCNGTSFSSYQGVDDDEEEDTTTFNITSGNGCTTTNEEKTIYARVKSKDDPTRTTRCSAEIYYDTLAPPIPTNIRATTQPNGSIKLMWNASEDTNTDSDILYKIYYSTQNNVTASSPFFETESTNYIHTLNQDTNVYYKLSATDEAGNESSLSATVIGSARKVGASLTITITPSNDYNNIIYVGAGNKKIKYTSDESLLGTPQVSIKQGSGSFVSIPTTYNSSTKSGESDYSFTTSGTGTVKIIAVNTRNETSTSEFNFTIDANIPNFDYNFSQNGTTYIFTVRNFPPDSYRVQYLLNNTTEICLKHKTDTNFNCIFDSNNTADGNYTLNILLYDFALNFTQKQLSFVIDNIDEDLISATELKSELDINVETIGQNIELFLALGLKDLDTSLNLKFDLAKADKSDGDNLFKEAKYIEANAKYLSAKNLITEINQNMPKIEIINSLETEYVYDENTSIPLNLISDVNITKDTLDLYKTKNISINRNFEVIQINNQKYFSVTLVINNTSSSDKTITVIEDIPKSFANSVELLSFTQIVDILLKDPVISYTATVPKNSTKEITYRLMKPITDVDAVTKVTTLNNTFMQPVVLSGSVSRDKISVKKVIDKNIFIYLISIIFLFILILIIINAITNYKTKLVKIEVKPDAKKEMADYLGTIKKENVENKELENTVKEVDEKKKSADKFQENYDYILSAIKKR